MSDKVLHATRIEFLPLLPSELAAGARLMPRIRLVCPFGCNIKGESVRLACGDDEEGTGLPLSTFRGQANETLEAAVAVPLDAVELKIGLYFDGAEGDIVDHAPCEAHFTLPVRADSEIALVVWGLPTPIVAGQALRFHVGAKTSVAAPLAEETVEVRDEQGRTLISAALGDAPWPGAEGLYWAEVEVIAPSVVGSARWIVCYPDKRTPTGEPLASLGFSFTTIPTPTNSLTVRVVDEVSGEPVAGAEIRLRTRDTGARATLSGRTDEEGAAVIAVPGGAFDVSVWKTNYVIEPRAIVVPDTDVLTITARLNRSSKPEKVWM